MNLLVNTKGVLGMRKALLVVVMIVMSVCVSQSAEIQWFGVGLYGPGGSALDSNWTVVMYQSASSVSLPDDIYMDGSTSQGDTLLPATTTISNPTAGGSFFDNGTYTDTGLGLTPETDYIFTVIFNTTSYGDLGTSDQYVIIDDNPFLVPDSSPDPAFPYNAGGTSPDGTDWADVVPEPGTMALFSIGAICLGFRQKRKK